jgi:hypothetical protein
MNWVIDFITSAGFQQVTYLCLGAAVTVLLTFWCQKVLIREQYKWQKRLADEQRNAEKQEKASRDEDMRDRIRRSFLKPQPFTSHSVDYGTAFGVTLKNETPWPVLIRDVMFHGPKGSVHTWCTGEKEIGDRKALERLPDETITMPPFSQGAWVWFNKDYRRPDSTFGDPYDNCTIKCEFTTVYDDTAVLEIPADPSLGEQLTDFSKSCKKSHANRVEQQNSPDKGQARGA